MRYPTVHSRIGLSVCVAVGLVLTSIFAPFGGPAEAREGNRTLKLYFGHTKERGEFTFKRNGRYDRAELARINRFLRDSVTFAGTAYRTRGSPWLGMPYSAAAFQAEAAGEVSLRFEGLDRATMSYTVDGVTQTKTIVRQPF